ncbi:MAG: HIT family protein [Gammaproteobacteria bacterium]|nr:HIT family protein [Gammaproteobacteria bacterium]
MTSDCLFCNIPQERIVLENDLAYAVSDGYPVTEMHSLVVPKRHVKEYFDLNTDELLACNQLIRSLKQEISDSDSSVDGSSRTC